MKFHVENPAESVAVQKKLFELRYQWFIGERNTTQLTEAPYLFTNLEGNISYSNIYATFKALKSEEISEQEFYKKEDHTMTTLEQQIKDTQERLEKLTKALQEESCKPKEWPQNNDFYYYVGYKNQCVLTYWTSGETDIHRKAMHNYFKTKAEAEHYKDWLKSPVTHSRYLLQKTADEYNKHWKYKPGLNTGYYMHLYGTHLTVTSNVSFRAAVIYFKDSEGCHKAIEVLGEDTIKIACGVV